MTPVMVAIIETILNHLACKQPNPLSVTQHFLTVITEVGVLVTEAIVRTFGWHEYSIKQLTMLCPFKFHHTNKLPLGLFRALLVHFHPVPRLQIFQLKSFFNTFNLIHHLGVFWCVDWQQDMAAFTAPYAFIHNLTIDDGARLNQCGQIARWNLYRESTWIMQTEHLVLSGPAGGILTNLEALHWHVVVDCGDPALSRNFTSHYTVLIAVLHFLYHIRAPVVGGCAPILGLVQGFGSHSGPVIASLHHFGGGRVWSAVTLQVVWAHISQITSTYSLNSPDFVSNVDHLITPSVAC
ncbi:hypothetical protein D3C79_622550 [compost metagenome]